METDTSSTSSVLTIEEQNRLKYTCSCDKFSYYTAITEAAVKDRGFGREMNRLEHLDGGDDCLDSDPEHLNLFNLAVEYHARKWLIDYIRARYPIPERKNIKIKTEDLDFIKEIFTALEEKSLEEMNRHIKHHILNVKYYEGLQRQFTNIAKVDSILAGTKMNLR